MPQAADAIPVLTRELIFLTFSWRAVLFIRIILTVVVSIADPRPADALPVVTVEVQGGASGQHAAIFVAVVPTVIVSITLPLSRDACTFPKSTDCTRKVIASTGAFGTTCYACKRNKQTVYFEQLSLF